MTKINRRTIHVLSERLHMSEDFLVHCVEYSLIEMEGRGKNSDLSPGPALRLRRIQRLSENLDIDVAIAALLLDRAERISRLEREIKVLQSLPLKRSSPGSFD